MKHIIVSILLILFLASCSQHQVKKETVEEKPLVVEEQIKPKLVLGIIPEAVIQKAENKYGFFARNRYEAYNKKLHKLQNSSTKVKLREINNFYNNVPYIDDMKIWHISDYWATPLEFLGKDKGDCEDYVIAKYFSLLDLGIKSEKLYFAYVKSIPLNKSHMVLSYFQTPYSMPLILDSLNLKIIPASKRTDLIHLYNFNGKSLYRSKNKWINGKRVKNTKLNNTWKNLIKNIENNKL